MATEKNDRNGSVWTEFYIEFLGSLVPGLFALFLSLIVIGIPLYVLCRALQSGKALALFPDKIDFGFGAYGVTGILLVVAYVLGYIFYRQDPKVPDWRSARRVYKYVSPSDREHLAVQPRSPSQMGRDDIHPNDAQFPYFFLYEYLKGRGLDHLAEWIPWRGKNSMTWKYRTKMFINQIKIRLQFLVPEHCKDIVRNEAHVRLATSVWYATRWIRGVSGLGVVILAIAFFISNSIRFDFFFSVAICADVLTFMLCFFLKRQIENFIHYLRVREIVYVLETAHFAVENGFDLHREDFDPKAKKHEMERHTVELGV